MRVLFVNPYYKPYLGGIERIIERVSAELRSNGAEAVGVLTTRVHFPDRVMSDLPDHEVMDGVEVFRATFRPATLPRVFHAALAGYLSLDIPQVLRTFKPDVIHFTYSEWWAANLNTYLFSLRTPHVLSTFFHAWPRRKTTMPLYAANRWLVRRMEAVVVSSEFEGRQVRLAYGAPAARILVIPPGVDAPTSIPERSGRDSVTVLAVGRLSRNKGQLLLVQMIHQLSLERPELKVRLWLAGGDAGDGQAIAQYVSQHRLEPMVQVLGYCADSQLADLYRQADIFALPSQVESFGIVFIEAMAYGLPVVAYGVGPVRSILSQGALLAPVGDERAFLDALRCLVHDPARRCQLGRDGRAMVMSRYTWRATGEQFYNLYRRLAEDRPSH